MSNLLAGLVRGFAVGKQQQFDRDQRKEASALQKQMMKLQMDALKLKNTEATTRQMMMKPIIDYMTQKLSPQGQEAGQTQATPLGDSFGESKGGVSGEIAMQQLMSDPLISSILKESTGIDFLGAGRLGEQQRRNTILERQGDERIDVSRGQLGQRTRANDLREQEMFGSYNMLQQEIPGEGTTTTLIPKILQGGGGLSIQTKPSERDKPISPEDLTKYYHPESGATPPPGTSERQAVSGGFIPLSDKQREAVYGIDQVLDILGQMEGLMEGVFPKQETVGQRIVAAPQRVLGSKLQTNMDAARLEKLINGTLAPIIRSMGEKGNLSDTDVKRAQNLFMKLTDRGDVAWAALEEIKGIMVRGKQRQLGIGSKKTQPAANTPPVDKLKEGVITSFTNGQRWTLKDGVPMRVEE